jgi:hypothetical protein
MKQKPSSRRRRSSTKSVLRLPDWEHAKAAVLNSLNSADAKWGYRHAIDESIDWYCSGSDDSGRIDGNPEVIIGTDLRGGMSPTPDCDGYRMTCALFLWSPEEARLKGVEP